MKWKLFMKKQPEIYLKHMLMAIEEIESFIKGFSYKKFINDSKTFSAVIRQLEIIGEAAGRVPKSLVKDSPNPWQDIIGMRNKLIHDYMGVDSEIVWDTASKGLKALKKYLQEKLK
jgi:uncharacterized protein with HEPN domain